MSQTEQALLEQLKISDFDIEYRKLLFSLTNEDCQLLEACKPIVEVRIDQLIDRFYERQTGVPEIAAMLSDAHALERLRAEQRNYVLDLFSGIYDLEYAKHRIRVGLGYTCVSIEPKLYLSSINMLKSLLMELIIENIADEIRRHATLKALNALLLFDVHLLIDAHVQSLIAALEASRKQCEHFVASLERKVQERTQHLERLASTDPLTGLQNIRFLHQTMTRILRAAQRRSEYVSVVFLDINDFKAINDTHGHQRGDELLRVVGAAIQQISRLEDSCFRYGGDEFCMILPNCREAEAHALYIGRLNAALKHQVENVRLSIGIAEAAPDASIEPAELIRLADKRMYQAKRMNKGI